MCPALLTRTECYVINAEKDSDFIEYEKEQYYIPLLPIQHLNVLV